ncbi:MAG: hypothetical protein RJB47_1447, partial [Pseudomonadota bacterium]
MSRFLQLVLDMFDGATTQALPGGLHADVVGPLARPALHGPHVPSEPLVHVLP